MLLVTLLRSLLGGGRAAAAPRPKLLVVVTVDQLRPEYLERYRTQLTGGFALLAKQGAEFADAYQDHAVTETAPGHATILSGPFPPHTRILPNAPRLPDLNPP